MEKYLWAELMNKPSTVEGLKAWHAQQEAVNEQFNIRASKYWPFHRYLVVMFHHQPLPNSRLGKCQQVGFIMSRTT